MADVLDILNEYRRSDSRRVRRNICTALGALGDWAAVKRLIDIGVEDDSEEVRNRAAEELAAISDVELRRKTAARVDALLDNRKTWRQGLTMAQALFPPDEPILRGSDPAGEFRGLGPAARLNWRLLTSRGHDHAFLGRLRFLSLFAALVATPLLLIAWFAVFSLGQLDADSELYAVIATFTTMVVLTVWPLSTLFYPQEIRIRRGQGAIIDVIVIGVIGLAFGIFVFLISYDLTAIETLFAISGLILPLVAARLSLLFRPFYGPRPISMLGRAAIGLLAVLVAAFGAAFIGDALSFEPNSDPFGMSEWDSASYFVLFGMVGGLFLVMFRSVHEPLPQVESVQAKLLSAFPAGLAALALILGTLALTRPPSTELPEILSFADQDTMTLELYPLRSGAVQMELEGPGTLTVDSEDRNLTIAFAGPSGRTLASPVLEVAADGIYGLDISYDRSWDVPAAYSVSPRSFLPILYGRLQAVMGNTAAREEFWPKRQVTLLWRPDGKPE